jgi:Flp pilus assembly protein TadD/SAM-dependent methyltransferase
VAAPLSGEAQLETASKLLQAGRLAEAEGTYRRILAREPGNARATHFLGIALFRSGRLEAGLDELRRSVGLAPAEPILAQNFGLILAEAGRLEEAESHFRRALSLRPGLASAQNYLGMALQQQGRLAEAIESYRGALALAPLDDTVHNNFGFALLEKGRIKEATEHLRQAVRINALNAMAHNNLGNALKAVSDIAGAQASYMRAIEIDPQLIMARCNLGALYIEEDRLGEALPHLRAAVAAAPANGAARQRLADALAHLRFDRPDPQAERELLDCLQREDVDGALLAAAAASLLRSGESMRGLLQAAAREPGDPGFWLRDGVLQALAHPLALALLEGAVVPERDFEQLIAVFRRAALQAWQSGTLPDHQRLAEILCAVAHQCFLAEYVHALAPAEEAGADALRERIESAGPERSRATELALLAAYRPLWQVSGSDRITDSSDSAFGRLVLRQVREPQEERRIAVALRELTPVRDPVSIAVRAQYEENPYPRWLHAPSQGGGETLALRLHRLFAQLKDAPEIPDRPRILIAGCGTGRHAVITAALHPRSRILAVDISRASLAYAERRCRALGARNVRFALADVLELGSVGERFDLIECAGVLHHLGDPLAGWRALLDLLEPNGYMKIALYSEAARRGVAAARELIAERGFAAGAAGIRSARSAIAALPEGAAARSVLSSLDFYSMSGCRDLIFHVQEHCFDPGRIAAAVAELGLEFLGFEFEDACVLAQYRRRYPQDAGATSLENWAAFEADSPDTFAGMYQFWVRRLGNSHSAG